MKKILITIGIALTGFIGWFLYEQPTPPFGAVLAQELDGQNINFSYEDNKTKEDLLIRTPTNSFGVGEDAYMAIQNTTAIDQNVTIVFSVKDKETFVYDFKEFVSNEDIVVPASSSPGHTKRVTNWTSGSRTKPDMVKLKKTKDVKTVSGDSTEGFVVFIPTGITKFFKYKMSAPLTPKINGIFEQSQEFYIEAYGDGGGYGHSY